MTPSEVWLWLKRKQELEAQGAQLRQGGQLLPYEQQYRGADPQPQMEMMVPYQESANLQDAKEIAMRNPSAPGFFNRVTPQSSAGYQMTQTDQSDMPGDYGAWGAAAARKRKWLQ